MIFDDIKSFSFSPNFDKQFGIKSGVVWGNSNKTNSNYPILYISKPKGISEEDFRILLEHIDINFINKQTPDTDVK